MDITITLFGGDVDGFEKSYIKWAGQHKNTKIGVMAQKRQGKDLITITGPDSEETGMMQLVKEARISGWKILSKR